MLFSGFGVKAETNVKTSYNNLFDGAILDYYEDDLLEIKEVSTYEELNGFSIEYEFDGINYTVMKVGCRIYVYEKEKANLLATATISELHGINENNPILYSTNIAWSAWYFYAQNNTQISWEQELTLGAVEGIVLTLLGVNGYVGTAASAATAIAVKIWNSHAENIVVKYYHSCASTCGILVKEKAKTYADGILTHEADKSDPFWMSSPYDYTQPAECRLLLNDYPY